MRTVAIILAGGMGSRFGGPIPKQLLPLAGKTVLAHTLKAFDDPTLIDELIVVANPEWRDQIELEVSNSLSQVEVSLVDGGATRNESLRNALDAVQVDDARILIHDSVRPLVSRKLIATVATRLLDERCVLPVVRSSDLLVHVADGRAEAFLDRAEVQRGQAPQGFRLSDLRAAFDRRHDEVTLRLATVYEAVRSVLPHVQVALVDGHEENIKITLPVDHMIAQRLLEDRDARNR